MSSSKETKRKPTPEWLYQKYIVEEMDFNDISKLCGWGKPFIRRIMRAAEIPFRSPGEGLALAAQQRRTTEFSHEWLYQKYVVEELHPRDMAKLRGLSSHSRIQRALDDVGIPRRTKKEAHRTTRSLQKKRDALTGPKHWNWKGGITERKRAPGFTPTLKADIRARNGNCCRTCGATENLNIHHINIDRDDHRPENLITLCNSCHAHVHAGNITLGG